MTKLNRRSWKQFVSLATPYWASDQKAFAFGMAGLLVVLLLAYTKFSVTFNQLLGEFTSSLAAEDSSRFWSAFRLFLLLLIIAIPINAFYYFVRDKLAIYWRQWLTGQFLNSYFGHRAYYDLASHPTIDNPDQRIAEDINTFTQKTLQFLLIVVNGLMQLIAFSAVLWAISRVLVICLVLYAILGTLVTVAAFGRGLTILNYLQLKREADLRFSLARIRDNVESIAFYQGEPQEKGLVWSRFERAFINYNKLIRWQLFLSMFQYANSYASYLVPYVVLAPAVLSGEAEVGTVVEAAGAFSACLVALNLIIDNFDGLSKFAAGIDRLDSFKKAIELNAASSRRTESIDYNVSDDLKLDHLTVQTPEGDRVLIKDLSLRISDGKDLVITGPSGCGKTSLLRAIMGLWTHGGGTIARPKLDDVLFLPQRPYMVPGSLRSQIYYPRQDASATDDELRQILNDVHLPRLANSASFDVEADWSKILSVGEQQRLSFARLLLLKPKYAFLDEATSALDPATEAELYGRLKETYTTLISISHHQAVRKYHELELEFLGDGAWRINTEARDDDDETWRLAESESVEQGAGK